MKLSATRRALLLANIFNLLVALYFIIIAIVGLAQLRWYHQLTVSVRAHYFITLATSYFSFFILMLVGLILIGLFTSSSLALANSQQEQQEQQQQRGQADFGGAPEGAIDASLVEPGERAAANNADKPLHHRAAAQRAVSPAANHARVVLRQSSLSAESNASACCSILLYLIVSVGLIATLVFWLFNTGELVRDNISTQLDYALARYQFTNRSNRFSIAIDGLQDSLNCCGSLDYTDFPHGRMSTLPPGHYPGSCCGKNIFGSNARVVCLGEDIWRAKQNIGCTTVLSDYYDLISLLVVPVALVCLFVNITIIALITISKGAANNGHDDLALGRPFGAGELATSGAGAREHT